ncbi:MAG: aconitate hydratase [Syntrophus sp. SKADARSKE-3]|nr:aconitate hydratase [Syntrophus sp. SKADARSKE-3]
MIAKSFERIHTANLVNFGIMPLRFQDDADYDAIDQGDRIEIAAVRKAVAAGEKLTVKNLTKGKSFDVSYDLTERQKAIVLAGGILNLRQTPGKI